jgi:glutathione S-transferase
MVLKLYATSFAAGGGSIVALVLAEKQIPFELVLVDLAAKEQKLPEFLAKNPWGKVPVIVSAFRARFIICFFFICAY